MKKIYLIIAGIVGTLIVGFIIFLVGFGLGIKNSKNLVGANQSAGFIGVYNSTTTDVVINNGYGGAIAIDQHGRVMLSPSSTLTTQ